MNLNQIKKRVPIDEVLRYYGSEECHGKWNCPFGEKHQNRDIHPSASIKNGKVTCHAYGCVKSDDVIGLVMKRENLPFPEACRVIETRFLGIHQADPHPPQGRLTPNRWTPRNECSETSKILRQYSNFFDDWATQEHWRNQAVLETAKGLDISNWSDEELDTALEVINKARERRRFVEQLADLAGNYKRTALDLEQRL